jgi:multidrug efflux system membrane fusion protein
LGSRYRLDNFLNGRRLIAIGLAAGLVAAAGYLLTRSGGHDSSAQRRDGKSAAGSVMPVTTAPVQVEDFAIRRRTIGILESPATVVVKSRIESQVVEQHVKDGQLVRKGDLLFTLDDREVRAAIARDEAQIAKDQATVDKTQTDLERYQRLSLTNAAPQQQVDQATADHKIALANVEAAKAQLRTDSLRLNYTKIEAPIGGRVGAVRVTAGNLISANDPTGLLTITQVRPIRVSFTLAERDLPALRKAGRSKEPTAVRVFTPGAAEPLATGTLDFVDSAVDPASGTIAAKGKFANEKFELWPGMYVDVEIDLDVRPNTAMIPAVAIQSGQKGPFVFVVKDAKAEMRAIELVGIEGNRAAIASGVNPGEQLVVEGQMRLANGARVVQVSSDGKPVGGGAPGARAPGAAEVRR